MYIRLAGAYCTVFERTLAATGHARRGLFIAAQAAVAVGLVKLQHFGVNGAEGAGVRARLATDATQVVALDDTVVLALDGVERAGDDAACVQALPAHE